MREHETKILSDRLEESFRAPLWVTLVFVVTMLAIYFMGRSVSRFYELPVLPASIENAA